MTDTTTMESTKMTYIRNEQGHYVCPECDVVKVKQNTMHYHMTKCRLKNKPVEERPTHTCEFCVASLPFLTAEALSLHLARMAGRSGHPEMDHIKDVECPFEDCDFHDINKGNVRASLLANGAALWWRLLREFACVRYVLSTKRAIGRKKCKCARDRVFARCASF